VKVGPGGKKLGDCKRRDISTAENGATINNLDEEKKKLPAVEGGGGKSSYKRCAQLHPREKRLKAPQGAG